MWVEKIFWVIKQNRGRGEKQISHIDTKIFHGFAVHFLLIHIRKNKFVLKSEKNFLVLLQESKSRGHIRISHTGKRKKIEDFEHMSGKERERQK